MKNEPIINGYFSKNTESTEILNYGIEYYNPFTGLNYNYFNQSVATDLDFILKMLKTDVDVCKYYPNFRIMVLQLKKFIKKLEEDERYEDCTFFQKYINEKRKDVPSSLVETKIQLEKYNEKYEIGKEMIETEDTISIFKIPLDIVMLYNIGFIYQLIDNLWLWDKTMPLTKEFLERGIQYPEYMAKEIFEIYFNNFKSRYPYDLS